MSLSIFLTHSIRIIYALLGAASLITYLRRRDPARLDIALAFGLIGAFNLVQEIDFVTHATPTWLVARFIQFVTIAHAYLILRLIQHFRTVPAWFMRTAVGGMLILFAAALLVPVWPAVLTLVMSIYLAALDIYSVVALVLGAWAARGVARWRMRFGALGAGLLATLLILTAALALVPALLPAFTLIIEFAAILSGLAFYIGFAPPRFLRRAWQLGELEGFLNASAAAAPDAPVLAALQRLTTAAVQAVGGRAAFVLAPPDWQVLVTTDETLVAAVVKADRPPEYWQQIAAGRSQFIARLTDWFQPGQAQALSAEAESALAVPMKTARQNWGVLVVLLRRGSLFPDDDLHLLELLKEQISLTIEQQALIGDFRQQTRELATANQQLGKTNRELETANRELEAFAYSVSHDLRTPLRHIDGFANLLADTHTVTEAGRRYVDNITTATARMAYLIDALLALSRLGHADLTLTRVPLDSLVQEVRADLEGEGRQRRVAWQISHLPVISGDPVLLRQVFNNLLSNALKYSRLRPDARIEVGTAPGEAGQAVIYVRDNGVGFDPQYANRLFVVFQRLHHPNEFEGDGIGLANVRRIVQRHGGRVWAEGALDVGATFYISLPLEADRREAKTTPEPAQPLATPEQVA